MPGISLRASSVAPVAGKSEQAVRVRGDAFGAQHRVFSVEPRHQGGWRYFRACNPTPGTGIATSAATAYSTSEAHLLMSVAKTDRALVVPHYVRLTCTATGGGTEFHGAMAVSDRRRYSSGGTNLLPSAFHANTMLGRAEGTMLRELFFGNISLLTTALPAQRVISRFILRRNPGQTVFPVVGDEFLFVFGGRTPSSGAGMPAPLFKSTGGTLEPQLVVVRTAPILLGAGDETLLLHTWGTSTGTPSYEVEVAWWERPLI